MGIDIQSLQFTPNDNKRGIRYNDESLIQKQLNAYGSQTYLF